MDIRNSFVVFLSIFSFLGINGSELSYHFYEKSCPQVESIVRTALAPIFLTDPTSPAALLRLMFHDCQVQGCDASILLDESSNGEMVPEMASSKNFGIRNRESIGVVKSMVEAECPGQVSCADILVLAAREAVSVSGGPQIRVPLGRRDSITMSYKLAEASLPSPNTRVDAMLHLFTIKGMNLEESVAILGAHTLGITHCLSILNRLKSHESSNKGEMSSDFEKLLKLSCKNGLGGSLSNNSTFVGNDLTVFVFDNQYYRDAIAGRGVLQIDADMSMDPQTAPIMARFAIDEDGFFQTFTSAFMKLSSSGVLTGNEGVIRKRCNEVV
ncbi:peroxidase 29 [Telopea speciosissima]|uniref:peroxidase 29 n=1 Tax=Telopea speciosissima TaxID=54955 RepID=UPI001CC5119C|nr:peroxidase 29 [Telopea speciosissima]